MVSEKSFDNGNILTYNGNVTAVNLFKLIYKNTVGINTFNLAYSVLTLM